MGKNKKAGTGAGSKYVLGHIDARVLAAMGTEAIQRAKFHEVPSKQRKKADAFGKGVIKYSRRKDAVGTLGELRAAKKYAAILQQTKNVSTLLNALGIQSTQKAGQLQQVWKAQNWVTKAKRLKENTAAHATANTASAMLNAKNLQLQAMNAALAERKAISNLAKRPTTLATATNKNNMVNTTAQKSAAYEKLRAQLNVAKVRQQQTRQAIESQLLKTKRVRNVSKAMANLLTNRQREAQEVAVASQNMQTQQKLARLRNAVSQQLNRAKVRTIVENQAARNLTGSRVSVVNALIAARR